ncbi:hypothetical protein I302_108729 [Kwoniella bestiolae CBS 10118]|uniref:Uncharacterized protein n=1 Tax=Kwoniella bestiolae CBS 10118 TaxID=1296100 RepID=A0A1B9FTY0_9TREE|nr:hypothetical protein I302_07866 [Kwoniella bestiolae CBS 10118]OCF22221.1 hypothetical protein I302_07866 [Kwoniella bestiolae CBS 10118]
MLRRIRAKLHPPILRPLSSIPALRLSSSAALARERDPEEDNQHEPYGIEYGAGPSRIPYQPRHALLQQYTQSHLDAPSPLQHSRVLRDTLNQLNFGAYAQPQIFYNALSKQSGLIGLPRHHNYEEDLAAISRLDLHIILHHLLRKKKGNLAAAVICDVLRTTTRDRRRKLLSLRTLSILFGDRSIFKMISGRPSKQTSLLPDITPSLEDQLPSPPSPQLATLLGIMESLQDVRYQRPIELYQLVIKQCVDESLFDLAAKVYVGLVEEWVTEGRVAHGADPDDFHPGGGPPRTIDSSRRQRLSKLLGHWWTGVRTWRLPGEVLSPHDRLDLWHPKNLSLGEKMKNFPLPIATSPPSLVPQPKRYLLDIIIHSLKLNPHTCSPQEFASSMRALAILANTVLSRTLPIVSLGRLLGAFKTAPSKPDVYPENITQVPAEYQWAYTSFTQIHVTLMSLLFSPPISSHSMQLIAENQDLNADNEMVDTISTTTNANQYMLPPLSWKSCTILLQYAFQSLRKPFALKRLLDYMKEVFRMGEGDPRAFNTILKGSSALQLNAIASQADMTIFGQQTYDRPSHAPPQRPDSRFFSSSQRVEREIPQEIRAMESEFVEETNGRIATSFERGESPLPSEASLLHLIKHLTVTSQFNRLEDLVYTLEPYLEFSRKMPAEEVLIRMNQKGLESGSSGRPRSQLLSHQVYLSLMRGLEKSGSTGLAQRMFNLALYAQRGRIKEYKEENPDIVDRTIPPSLKFPLEGYKIMLDVWSNETRSTNRRHKRRNNDLSKEVPLGWMIPEAYARLPRGVAAGYMTMVTHHLARKAHAPREFTEGYYKSLIRACRWRWKLSEDKQPHHEFRVEIKNVILDIQDAGLEVPELLRDKLTDRRSGARFRWGESSNKMGRKERTDEEVLLGRLLGDEGVEAFVRDSSGDAKRSDM